MKKAFLLCMVITFRIVMGNLFSQTMPATGASPGNSNQVYGVSIEQYKQDVNRLGIEKEFILIDIDTVENYMLNHLDGAISAPAMTPQQIDTAIDRVRDIRYRRLGAATGTDLWIRIYAHNSIAKAKEMAQKLANFYSDRIEYLDFTLAEWKSAGGTVVRKDLLRNIPSQQGLSPASTAQALNMRRHTSDIPGFDIEPGEICLTNYIPFDKMVSFSEVENTKIRIKNDDTKIRTFKIRVITCKEGESNIRPGYEDIPDTSWVLPEQTEFQITGNSIRETDLFIRIPSKKEHWNKKYQAILEVRMEKDKPEDLFVLVARSQILFYTNPVEAGLKLTIITAGDVALGDNYVDEIRFLKYLVRTYKNFEVVKVGPDSQEGKNLIKKLKIDFLPAYIFDKQIERTAKNWEFDILNLVKNKVLTRQSDGSYLFSALGRPGIFINRVRTPDTLDIFSVSRHSDFITFMIDLIYARKDMRIPPGIKIQVHYLAPVEIQQSSTGTIVYQGFKPEWEESVRQMYIRKQYGDEKYFDYILAKSRDPFTTLCDKYMTEAGITDTAAITKFLDTQEAHRMFDENLKKADELGIKLGGGGSYIYILYENRILLNKAFLLKNFYGFENLNLESR